MQANQQLPRMITAQTVDAETTAGVDVPRASATCIPAVPARGMQMGVSGQFIHLYAYRGLAVNLMSSCKPYDTLI